MKVYRYLSEEELNSILSGNKDTLGQTFSHDKKVRKNTHKYKPATKYIHFFKNEQSMKMASYLYRNIDSNFYFCTFDVPLHILVLHSGKGFYPASGFDNITVLKEYAIPINNFNPQWLKSYEKDNNHRSITFKDVANLSI